MGMSASQARLISLTARMSDTEYEAQQVNQQRLTISNQMNAVYEAMCNMEVPTPPSKLDFRNDKYIGKISGNSITVIPDSNTGNPVAYQTTKGSIVEATAGTMGGNPTIKLGADIKSTATDGNLGVVDDFDSAEYYIDVDHEFGKEVFTKLNVNDFVEVVGGTDVTQPWSGGECIPHYYGTMLVPSDNGETDDDGNPIMEPKTLSKEDAITNKGSVDWAEEPSVYYTGHKPVTTSDFVAGKMYRDADGVKDVVDAQELSGEDALAHNKDVDKYSSMTWATKDSNGEYKIFTGNDFDSIGDKKLYKVMNPEQYKAAVAANEESVKTGIIGVADAKATSLGTSLAGLYVVTGSGECRPLSEADCKKDANGNYYLLDSSLVVKKQDNNGTVYKDTETRTGKTVTSADGKKTGTTLSIEQAKHDYGEKFETAWQALKHRYESSGKSDEEIEALFTVVNYGDGTFAFVMTSDYDDNSPDVMVYEVTEGTYDKKMEDGTYKIERDASGNVNKIVMSDGAASSLNLADAYNELEYEAAVASYNAKKAEYDQEQNRLNKQTSIYQRQDKMLELKLTRLDNERNALNTEIEAVKKVIQDAIDRGFKTFSG